MDESYDAFLGGRVHAHQPINGFRAGTDTMLLMASIEAKSGQRVLELGCGSGVGLLCLAERVSGLELFGVDILEENIERAKRNLETVDSPSHFLSADIFDSQNPMLKDQYDHVMMNPPFYEQSAHSHPQEQSKTLAHIAFQPIQEWVKFGIKRARAQGLVTMIYPSEGLADILSAIPKGNSAKIRPIISKAGENPKRILVQIQTQSQARFKLLAPIILNDSEGNLTESGKAISLGNYDIPWT